MTAGDSRARLGLVLVVGGALGASAAASGLFETAAWRPVALGVFALALALVVGAGARPGWLALGALAGLVVVWGWAWLSVGWAESTSRAETMASRWGLHVAMFAVFVLIVRGARSRAAGLAALALPALCIGVWMLVRMVAGSGPGLFVGNQLTSPLGYSNADATFFLLAAWPLVAAAESRRLLVSTAGVTALTSVGGLVALTQSRGAIVAFAVAAVAVVALVPGRARRIWALVGAGAGVTLLAAAFDVLEPSIQATGLPGKGDLRETGLGIAAVSLVIGFAWAAGNAAARRVAARPSGGARVVARASTAGLAALAVLALLGLGLGAGRISDRISTEYDDLVHLKARAGDESTLLGGGPNQYDYWRIAIDEFRDAPLKGVGGGDYQRDYFRARRTNEDVRQPHSLLFQTLAELGLIGILGLAAFVLATLTGLWQTARRASTSLADRRVAVGAGGAFVTWLVHASIDWTWMFPTIMGLGLFTAALLVAVPRDVAAPREGDAAARRVPRTAAAYVALVVVAALALGASAFAVARQIATQHYRGQARSALGDDPARALERTSKALSLGDEDVGTHYIRAAAFARLDDFASARSELGIAAGLEPHSWVTQALIGDLELRKGHVGHARLAYRRALSLNPRDQGLRQAAADPRAVARTLGIAAER